MELEQWTNAEKKIARRAFEAAYDRECVALADEVRRRADRIANTQDIWKLESFLTRKRKHIDEKYDFRYSVLVVVFIRLMKEGWLKESDLVGLSDDKLVKIRVFAE